MGSNMMEGTMDPRHLGVQAQFEGVCTTVVSRLSTYPTSTRGLGK